MSREKGQQQPITRHFQPVAQTQDAEKEKENRIYPLFVANKKKITDKNAQPTEADQTNSLNPTTPIIVEDKSSATAGTDIAEQVRTTPVLKRPKAPSIPRPDPFEKLVSTTRHKFYAKQKKQRETAAAAAQTQHDHVLKKPKRLTKKDIERRMTQCYTEAWKSDKCCRSLFDRFSKIDHSDKKVPWVQKYRPENVEGLLGCSSYHEYLRNWLNLLKLKPASTSENEQQKKSSARKKSKSQLSSKQRKRTKKGETDDDMELLDEDKLDELSNLILLVGGHGLGKSAAVYTAAKETSYTIFEINAASRRAGKDIADKIGEMTESHLVRFDTHTRKRKLERETIVIRDTVKKKKKKVDIADHFKRLLTVSGQQHDKEVEAGNEEENIEVEVTIEETESEQKKNKNTLQVCFKKAEEKQRELLKNRPKQSLVLLEEVDILYDEDKGFWPAVIDLCQKSRRPVIMTCNDESKIPFDSLNFQQIIHFEIPQKNSMIPYLHLICLFENCIVDAQDIEYLCESFGYDLRQILNLLQFWLAKSRQHDGEVDGHIIFSHLFAHIMGFADLLDHGDYVVFMDRLKGLSEKTLMLCKKYFLALRRRRGRKPGDIDIDAIYQAMDNLAFADASIGMTVRQRHQVYDGDQYDDADSVNGDRTLWKRPGYLDHWDLSEAIENTVSIKNIASVKDLNWRDYLSSWSTHDEELDKQSETTRSDCIEILCPSIVDIPYCKLNEEVFMEEYMPTIRSLCKYDQGVAGKGRTQRSRRKIRYIRLENECRDLISWEPSE